MCDGLADGLACSRVVGWLFLQAFGVLQGVKMIAVTVVVIITVSGSSSSRSRSGNNNCCVYPKTWQSLATGETN